MSVSRASPAAGSFSIVDSTAVLREVEDRLSQWRVLLREHPSSARKGLKQLIIGRLDMAPDEETAGYRFRGQGTLQPLIAGLIPGEDAAPPSDGSGWGFNPCFASLRKWALRFSPVSDLLQDRPDGAGGLGDVREQLAEEPVA